jgi:hypothetical protein
MKFSSGTMDLWLEISGWMVQPPASWTISRRFWKETTRPDSHQTTLGQYRFWVQWHELYHCWASLVHLFVVQLQLILMRIYHLIDAELWNMTGFFDIGNTSATCIELPDCQIKSFICIKIHYI